MYNVSPELLRTRLVRVVSTPQVSEGCDLGMGVREW